MKVIYYFNNQHTVMYMWQIYHFVDELAHYGCEIQICNPSDFSSVDEANEELLTTIKEKHFDLFMTCHNEKLLYIDTLLEIKKSGVPTLLFCPDNLTVPYNHEKIANVFDLVWLTSKETEYLFKKWGCKTIFLPYAANPYFLKPCIHNEEVLCIGFIGTPHGSRIDRINKLLKAGIPVCAHSKKEDFDGKLIKAPISSYVKALSDAMHYPIGRKLIQGAFIDKLGHRKLNTESSCFMHKDPVSLEQLGKKNSEYALILAFSEAQSTGVLQKPVPIVNLRNFEIPMSGGIEVVRYTDELASYFENGKEIVLCHNDEEFIDKCRFYLRTDNEVIRKNMKEAARKRAANEHTWKNRFDLIFEQLGLEDI